jgi:hypothetical protein
MRHAASLVSRGHKNRFVLLVPNTDRDLLGLIFEVVKDLDVSIDRVMPDGDDDNDIMQLACLAHWDIAFLIVNNIRYPEDVRIQDGAIQLIHNLSRFDRPIVACYRLAERRRVRKGPAGRRCYGSIQDPVQQLGD